MSDDEEGRFFLWNAGGDFVRSLKNERGHGRVDADGVAVVNGFSVDPAGGTGEFEFTGNDLLGEIPFADKVGNDVNFLGVDHVEGFAHRRFFLPKTAMDFAEDFAISNFAGVVEIGRRGVGVLGGSVSDDEQSRIGLWGEIHAGP